MIDILQHYGFSEKEAKVYLAGLELGSAPGSTIARTAGEKRVTVYSIIKELIKKWYMTELKRNGMNYFSVISPDILASQLEAKYTAFKQKLPELMVLAEKFGNKPKVQFFEWVEWLEHMYDDLLTSKTDINSFLGTDSTHKELLEYLYNEFLPHRKENGIYANVLLPASRENQKYVGIDKKWYKTSKTIKHPLFNIEWEINIYGPNKVSIALFDKKELSWLIIQSEKLYTSMKSIFSVLWDM